MSEDSANPADVAEQQQDLDGGLPAAGGRADLPFDANEADVLEQDTDVPRDDDEDRRG